MRVIFVIVVLTIIACFMYFTFLMPHSVDKVPVIEKGKWILSKDFQYTKKDSVTVDFNVVNTCEDTLYVQVSEWFIFGVFSRFQKVASAPLYSEKNTITFIAQFPRFVKAQYSTDMGGENIMIEPRYNMYKYLQLGPREEQKIHLNLGYNITSHLNLIFNDFKFNVQLFYYTQDEWFDIKNHTDAKIDKYIIQKSDSSLYIDIMTIGQNSLINESEYIRMDYTLPLNPGVASEFILK
jgi:hypothetical protein